MTDIQILDDWPSAIANECDRATQSIILSTMSMHLPAAGASNPFAQLWAALESASTRGIRPMIYLAAPTKVHPATISNGIAAGRAQRRGISTTFVPTPRLLHAKCAIIDHATVFIGSANLTAAAASVNRELYLRFDHHVVAHDIEQRLQLWAAA